MSDLAQATESSEAADKILAASRLQSLADVSAVFAEVSLDYTSAIDTVTRRIAELLGDLCAVLLLSDDGVWLEPVAIRHPDAQSERMARSLTNLLRVPALGGLGNVVVGEGQAVAVEKLEDWMFSDVTRPFYYSYRELVGDFGMLAAPLRAQGKIIGMVLVLRTHSARAHPTDLRYLQDLADRAAITIAGARLHQSVQQELAARWAAEQALLRSERELRTLVENSPDSILRYDRELRIVYINHVAATLLGQPPEQLLGRTLDEIEMLRTATGNFRRHAQQVLATGEPQAYTEELRAADGELRFFHAQIVPEFGSQGTVESILVIARDLTDQRRTQKEIEQLNRTLEARVLQRTAQLQSAYQELHEITRLHQASQARLQFVLSQTPAVIFTAHYDGDHALTFISDSVRDLVGFEPQQFYESPGLWFERVHPEDRDALFSHLRALLSDGRRTIEYRFRHADGTDRWLRSGMSLIRDASGEPQEVIGYLVDISEHKETEEALRLANVELHLANVELARAARLKDEFLASVSHELRTPLNAILGRVETLQEQIHGPLNERQMRAARSIEESGRHLLDLINDILDLSKIEAGRLELSLAPVSVAALCQASLRMVAQSALKKRISVSSYIQPGLTMFQGDERRLKQLLVNLLSNAVKFTPEDGSIGLEVRGDREAGELQFVVWDTGIGIAKEDIGRLFKPFVQLDSGLARQYNGTGLGLVLVARMAELHGGHVSVESEPGRGSRFSVTLPWREPTLLGTGGERRSSASAPRAVQEPHTHYDPATRPLVLLAEDNAENIAVMQEYITRHGYRVETARDGHEAVTRAEELRPAVILMDIQMPGMNGLEAIARIRANPALADVPIIALTALAMPGDRERCMAAGASGYLSKPVGLRDLVRAIEAHRSTAQEQRQ